MDDSVKIPVQVCRENVSLPVYAKPGDAGMDVRSAVNIIIDPLSTVLIPTGLKVAIPEGYEIQVRPRSGLSLKTPLRIPNAPGTIDAGFRDEICVIMYNSSPDTSYEIHFGDRIAQLVLQKVPTIDFVPVEDVSIYGADRGGGFGSTGL